MIVLGVVLLILGFVEDVPSLVELRWRPGEHQAAFT